MNFYNDNDPDNCEWLRNLIAAGLIPPGHVDGRSITEISPNDLIGYTQCHFFAGVGGWPLALRLAGVPDDEPIDSGSCPCQPFSQTGLGLGINDPRHLWPVFRDLIAFRETPKVVGEQVASEAGRVWLDGVSADLEGLGFAVGAADLCAAGVGSPNIRQRLYWVAHANQLPRHKGSAIENRSYPRGDAFARSGLGCGGSIGRLDNADRTGSFSGRQAATADGHGRSAVTNSGTCGLGDAHGTGPQRRLERGNGGSKRPAGAPSLGMWSDFDLIGCADGKQRRIEPGSFPLAHGIPTRVGPVLAALRPMGGSAIKAARANRVLRLHAYGNAINVQLAAEFIRCAL